MSRKLATLRRITKLLPIEGADLIELALIDGWQCVVEKNTYKEGDIAVYFEIDSFLSADDPRYASFEERFTNWGDKRGMRVKTIRLKKQLSQGLLLPVSKFPEIKSPSEGDDVTDLLRIEKWEPIEEAYHNNGGTTNGGGTRSFPSFIPKTDQPRAQNIVQAISASANNGEVFERTIKLDGSSLTAYIVRPDSPHYQEALRMKSKSQKLGIVQKLVHWYKTKFNRYTDPVTAVCSRNIQLKDNDGSNFWKVVDNQQIVEILHALAETNKTSYAIQGEMIGPNIQNNYEKVNDHKFFMFDIYDIDNGRYLLPKERLEIAAKMEIEHVPVDHIGDLKSLIEVHDDDIIGTEIVPTILAFADGPGVNASVKREGHVYKSTTRDFSFKAISNSYLVNLEKKRK